MLAPSDVLAYVLRYAATPFNLPETSSRTRLNGVAQEWLHLPVQVQEDHSPSCVPPGWIIW